MNELRRKLAKFFYRNSDRGIRNLMLFIGIGNAVVYVFSLIDPSRLFYSLLRFDRAAILRGEVWRLFTYIFTYLIDAKGLNLLLGIVSLLCYYFIGKTLERYWGTLRFNCYYLTGIVLMDVAALLIGCSADTYYLNLSLFLAIATIVPDTKFLVFYIIPVKAKYLAWVDIILTLFDVISGLLAVPYYGFSLKYILFCLFPVISLLNYVLFFGKDIQNILPDVIRYRSSKTQKNFRASQKPNPNWSANYASSTGEKPYHHKCTVCGRTDVTNPELEFRYCSRCNGYYCYCMEHINNHAHIQ